MEDGRTAQKQQMLQQLRQLECRPPVRIEGPPAMHAVCYKHPLSGEVTVCLVNSFGWFRSSRQPNPELDNATPPPPCDEVTINFAADQGRPEDVVEAVSGERLAVEQTGAGWTVRVPKFQINACVVARFPAAE